MGVLLNSNSNAKFKMLLSVSEGKLIYRGSRHDLSLFKESVFRQSFRKIII